MAKVSDYLKNIFFILLLLSVAPKLINTIKKEYTKNLEPHTNVGLLPIKGFLSESYHLNKHLKQFFKDTDIKAIFIEIESPGGANGTGQGLFNEINLLKKEYPKPVIVYTENVCASAAYWIACAADCIVSSGVSFIGSIGCFFPYQFKLNEVMADHHIGYNMVQSGKYKTVGDYFQAATEEGNAYLQNLANNVYEQFIHDVAQSRKLATTPEAIDTWANGKVFTGTQAYNLKLVDILGSRSTAIEEIKKRGIIEGKINWVKPPSVNKWAKIFGFEEEDTESEEPILKSMTHTILDAIYSYFDKKGMQVR